MIWTVNLLGRDAQSVIRPILAAADTIDLHDTVLDVKELSKIEVEDAQTLIKAARAEEKRKTRITFVSPCAFKQGGRYAIYPQEALLLQSLLMRWNAVFPDFTLED